MSQFTVRCQLVLGSLLYSDHSRTGTGGTGSSYKGSSAYTQSSTQPASTTAAAAQGEIIVPLYEEQVVVGTRITESGGARLSKAVTTETINQPVQIRRETLVIDRQAAASGSHASSGQTNGSSGSLATPFEEGEFVIHLYREEPVVEMRVVPSGKIVVQRRSNTQQTNIVREVRREKINVQKMGETQDVIVSENVGKESNEAVGAAPPERQEIKGQQGNEPVKRPVAAEQSQPFPRPQPDGHETFPELHKNK